METKLTLNKKSSFDNVSITKLILLIISIFNKKLPSIHYRILLTLISLLITTITFGQSNSCNADIKSNRGNTRNSPLDGTYYSMKLTNTSNSPDTYIINTINVNKTCQNSDGSSVSNNIVLNNSILDLEKNIINKIILGAGESTNFYIHITVPNGSPLNKWSCLQVLATSSNCPNYSVNTILHTLTIDTSLDK